MGERTGPQDYFSSYEDLDVHRLMLSDKERVTAYQDAIFKNKDLFEGKTVMDIGAGTGILSLFCAKVGAKKVYAVEASNIATVTREIVEENNLSDVIEVIHSRVEDVTLPEDRRVDVIVSEWMGFYLLHESMLDSVLFARDKFLKKSGGKIFPEYAEIYAAPCTLEALRKEECNFWDNVYGFTMQCVKKHVSQLKMLKPEVTVVRDGELLSEESLVYSIDLRTAKAKDIESFKSRNFTSVNKMGLYEGVCLWFVCKFPVGESKQPVMLSSSPKTNPTHWKQTVVILPKSMNVETDDVIGWELSFAKSQENSRHYNIEFTMLDPMTERHPVPCNCQMTKCKVIQAYLSQYGGEHEKEENESVIDLCDDKDENVSDSELG